MALDDLGNVYITGNTRIATFYTLCITIKYSSSGVQQWYREYGEGVPGTNYSGTDITVKDPENVYVTGSGGFDFATIKYNSNGDSLWVRKYNGPGNISESANSIAVDISGNVYITGLSRGIETVNDYATIKYNPQESSSGFKDMTDLQIVMM